MIKPLMIGMFLCIGALFVLVIYRIMEDEIGGPTQDIILRVIISSLLISGFLTIVVSSLRAVS